jgi:hypothetical protein
MVWFRSMGFSFDASLEPRPRAQERGRLAEVLGHNVELFLIPQASKVVQHLGNKVVQASRSATARDQELHEERMREAQVREDRSPQSRTQPNSNDLHSHPRSGDSPAKQKKFQTFGSFLKKNLKKLEA